MKKERKAKIYSTEIQKAISKEKKEIEEIRKIFRSNGITGEDACKIIFATRRGGYEV